MSRSYGVDDEIDMSELDDELAAIDEQLAIEDEVDHPCAVSVFGPMSAQRLTGCRTR